MRINHNIAALNTFNQLSKNSELTNKSLSKLSSGMRINRAGDDPAGLSISEKMRSQVRGLNQATRNAQDGISLIQTAEGALNETTSIIQRMRELAVQAGNDTSTAEDRSTIKSELDQLAQEVTRISDSTKFNGQLLMASTSQWSGSLQIGADAGQTLTVSMSAMDAVTLGIGTDASAAASAGEISFVSGTGDEYASGGVDVTGYTQGTDLAIKVDVTTAGDGTTAIVANVTVNGVTREITADAVGATGDLTLAAADFGDIFGSGQQVVLTNAVAVEVGDEVNIAVNGAQSGVASLAVDTTSNAGTAITAFDTAIKNVSTQRSTLGSYQNRLEYTIKNLGTAAENLTAAESRIRDVDMASEMVEFTKNNILSQAAQSMLAQANQAPQGVLQLLR